MPHVEVPSSGVSYSGKFVPTETALAANEQITNSGEGLLVVYIAVEFNSEQAEGTELWLVQYEKGKGEIGQQKIFWPKNTAVAKLVFTMVLGPGQKFKVKVDKGTVKAMSYSVVAL